MNGPAYGLLAMVATGFLYCAMLAALGFIAGSLVVVMVHTGTHVVTTAVEVTVGVLVTVNVVIFSCCTESEAVLGCIVTSVPEPGADTVALTSIAEAVG